MPCNPVALLCTGTVALASTSCLACPLAILGRSSRSAAGRDAARRAALPAFEKYTVLQQQSFVTVLVAIYDHNCVNTLTPNHRSGNHGLLGNTMSLHSISCGEHLCMLISTDV